MAFFTNPLLRVLKLVMDFFNYLNFEIMEKINICENQDITWIKKIKLYKDIFWVLPWNEWFICGNCWKIYPKFFIWNCDCQNPKLEPFYKNSELKKTFWELSTKNNYREFVAKILEENIWFIWWWNTNIFDINKDKLWLDEKRLNDLKDWILQAFKDFDLENFYYLSEMWVKNEFRWNDIAWELYRKNMELLKNSWSKYVLVRTTKKSDVPYKWFKREWYKEVFCYNDEQNRVILAYKI